MKVCSSNNYYSYTADIHNHMTFLCKGKYRRYKCFICFYKGASLRRYYPGQVVRVRNHRFQSQQSAPLACICIKFFSTISWKRIKVKYVLGKVHVLEIKFGEIISDFFKIINFMSYAFALGGKYWESCPFPYEKDG